MVNILYPISYQYPAIQVCAISANRWQFKGPKRDIFQTIQKQRIFPQHASKCFIHYLQVRNASFDGTSSATSTLQDSRKSSAGGLSNVCGLTVDSASSTLPLIHSPGKIAHAHTVVNVFHLPTTSVIFGLVSCTHYRAPPPIWPFSMIAVVEL